jgi:hypothetical protein
MRPKTEPFGVEFVGAGARDVTLEVSTLGSIPPGRPREGRRFAMASLT